MAPSRLAGVLSLVAICTAGVLASAGDQGQALTRDQGPTVPAAVRERAARDGRVRVIVALRLAGSSATDSEARLAQGGGATAVAARRQDIATTRARVLTSMSGKASRETRRYQTLPFVALEVGAEALAALEASPDVARVTLDRIFKPSLENSVPRIEGDQAWEAGYDGTGTSVAILDSGVDAGHPFLNGKVIREACFSSTAEAMSQSVCPNGLPTQTGAGAAAPCQFDECIHGTHVAGIAAGRGEEFSGVAKGADVIAVQVFSEILDGGLCGGNAPCLGGFESDIIAGLEYVYSLKLDGLNIAAANMSLGGGDFDAPCDTEPFKPAIDNLRGLGVATIVAAGNNSQPGSLSSPACISSVVSVGATDLVDSVAWFSNVAPFLSLFAPGDGIVSSIPGGDFAELSGTSMAAPHVAGAWAVIRQAVPGVSVDAALTALQTTGLPVTDIRDWAAGTTTIPRVRLFRALASLTTINNPSPTLTSATPASGRAGLPLTMTLIGTGFNARSIVRWNGVDVASVTERVTAITAVVPAAAVTIGTSHVQVFNPAPGGGTSAAISIEVLPPPALTVDKTVVGPGEDVTVTLTNGFGGPLDWLALASGGAPDGNYLASTFVGEGVTTRTWAVTMPATAGAYEFRLFLNNGFDRAATSPSFTVDPAITPVPILSSISQTEAVAGLTTSPITLTLLGSRFAATSVVRWNGSARPTTFVSPSQLQATFSPADLASAGAFPVTVFTPAPGGGTSAALTFTVLPAPVLTVGATSAVAGSSITVTLANGLGGSLDYIAFADAGAADNNYVEFTYVGANLTSRTWTVTAPSTPGAYQFRLFKQGSFLRLATSPTVNVTAPPSPTLTVSATSVNGGQSVTVTLTNGQGGNQDWLSFAATGAVDNNYVQFTYVGAGVTTRTWTINAPSTGGTYEFRLYRNGGFQRLATSPTVTVTGPPPPPPSLTVSQTTVAPGASVTVSLTNSPGGASDFLALAATGAPDGTYLQSQIVGSGVTSRTWTVTMPSTAGTYEFRLFVVNGTTVRRATSPVVTVQVQATPELTVSATTVAAGAAITVTLTNGFGGAQDWIAFAATSAANNNYVQFVYVGAGVTTRTWTISAPATAGTYEFRLFRSGGFTRAATSPTVTVQPPGLTPSASAVAPGQSITVTLTNGLGGASDWIAFAAVGAPDNSYLNWIYVGAGVTTRTWTVTAPATPGQYEFRLYRQGTFSRVATSPPVQVGGGGD